MTTHLRVTRLLLPAAVTLALAVTALTLPLQTAHAAITQGVSGTVTGAGYGTLEGGQVDIVPLDGQDLGFGEVQVKENGTYSVTVPAGEYLLRFSGYGGPDKWAPEWSGDSPTRAGATSVTVTEDQVTTANAELNVGGSISGVVAQDTSEIGSHDTKVDAYLQDAGAPGGWVYVGWALADESHTYTLSGLATGTYKLFFDLRYSNREGWWENGTTLEDASGVAVTAPAATAGISPVNLKKYPRITGKATSAATGLPVADVVVEAYYATAAGWELDFDHSAVTAADGTYTLGLPSGSVRLSFEAPGSTGLAKEYWDDALTVDAATTISADPDAIITGTDAALGAAPTSISNTAVPKVTGAARVGSVLTSTEGTWHPEVLMFVAHQWRRNGVAIPGAVDETYTVTTADVGKRLTNTVTMQNATLGTASATSAPTAVVPALVFKLTSSAALLGKLKVGKVLRAIAPRSTPTAAVSFQWLRNGRAIGGAAAKRASYKLVRADKRKKIGARITLRRLGYTTVVRTVVRPAKVR